MSIVKEDVKYRALDQWFASLQGRHMADAFVDELSRFKHLFKGRSLLQLGAAGDNPWLEHFKISEQWIASPDNTSKQIQLVCDLNELPIERNSMDVVIAPMTLEAVSDKMSIIDEIDRVLKPMGCVIILGINPWGLWNLGAKLGFFSCFDGVSPVIHSPISLNHVFVQRGYRQCVLKHFWYVPPVKNERWIARLSFLNLVGKMLWPFPSGFYCYIAQKHEPGYPSMLVKTNKRSLSAKYKSGLQPVTHSCIDD